LTEQLEAEAVFLDLIVASFGPLTSGSGGGSVVGEEGEACYVICPGYGVLRYCGGRISRDCSR